MAAAPFAAAFPSNPSQRENQAAAGAEAASCRMAVAGVRMKGAPAETRSSRGAGMMSGDFGTISSTNHSFGDGVKEMRMIEVKNHLDPLIDMETVGGPHAGDE